MIRDLINNSTVKSLLPAVQSLAATLTGGAVDLKGMARKVLVVLDVGGVEGTDPAVAARIEESADGTTWTTLHAFASQITAATLVVDLTPAQSRIRAVAVVSGGVAAGATLAIEAVIYLERARPSTI